MGGADWTSRAESNGLAACQQGVAAFLRRDPDHACYDRWHRASAGGRRGGDHHAVLRAGAAGGDAGHRGRRLGADAAVAPPRRVRALSLDTVQHTGHRGRWLGADAAVAPQRRVRKHPAAAAPMLRTGHTIRRRPAVKLGAGTHGVRYPRMLGRHALIERNRRTKTARRRADDCFNYAGGRPPARQWA